jgi:nicotinate-nucleotide pyrophosphorylase (carboxylating)
MARSAPRGRAAIGPAIDFGRPGDAIAKLIALALEEDVGPGDRTAQACVPAAATGGGLIVAKETLVVSGVSAAARVFRALDPSCELTASKGEGDEAGPGDTVLRVRGSLRAILTGERTALNLVMRLSGVATLTRTYVRALAGTRTKLLDTRKTTPGMRELEKAAVRAGGGLNHRGALFDGILVKDNHAAAAGGVGEAVRRARAGAHPLLKIEAEVSTPEQIEEALEAGADMLLLDNLGDEELRRAVHQVGGRVRLEASGGMTLDRLPRVAATGVDYVSVGALTHSAPAVDLSLLVEADS